MSIPVIKPGREYVVLVPLNADGNKGLTLRDLFQRHGASVSVVTAFGVTGMSMIEVAREDTDKP